MRCSTRRSSSSSPTTARLKHAAAATPHPPLAGRTRRSIRGGPRRALRRSRRGPCCRLRRAQTGPEPSRTISSRIRAGSSVGCLAFGLTNTPQTTAATSGRPHPSTQAATPSNCVNPKYPSDASIASSSRNRRPALACFTEAPYPAWRGRLMGICKRRAGSRCVADAFVCSGCRSRREWTAEPRSRSSGDRASVS